MLGSVVKDYFALTPVSGKVGIEVEMELTKSVTHGFVDEFLNSPACKLWKYTDDGSLKKNGIEWVLQKPVAKGVVGPALSSLEELISSQGYGWDDTIRAGVHIHLNAQTWTFDKLVKFITTYYTVETVLTRFCGEGRSGNQFCLRARDAEYIIMMWYQALTGDLYQLRTNDVRYGALNPKPLFSYGSLEFRALRTPQDLGKIHEWVKILLALEEYVDGISTPWENLALMSGSGEENYLKAIFGEQLSGKLWYEGAAIDIMKDSRSMQPLCRAYQILKDRENV